jgi:hypothetical protein
MRNIIIIIIIIIIDYRLLVRGMVVGLLAEATHLSLLRNVQDWLWGFMKPRTQWIKNILFRDKAVGAWS